MTSLRDRLREDLISARKARDPALTLVLGTTLADVENHQLATPTPLADAAVVEVLRRAVKRRRESEEAYRRADRPLLAERERIEGAVLTRYLPAEASEDELRSAVRAAVNGGATSIGVVMSRVMPMFKGRADGAVLNRLAREEFGLDS